ncbi:hypothetical protein GGF31_005655 [Allomyces arbusculus]|nr:hypothetical protein GGF31_005655 [Allomyces arbusculus]
MSMFGLSLGPSETVTLKGMRALFVFEDKAFCPTIRVANSYARDNFWSTSGWCVDLSSLQLKDLKVVFSEKLPVFSLAFALADVDLAEIGDEDEYKYDDLARFSIAEDVWVSVACASQFVEEDKLRKLFAHLGEIKSLALKSSGHECTIEYVKPGDALLALQLDGEPFYDRALAVEPLPAPLDEDQLARIARTARIDNVPASVTLEQLRQVFAQADGVRRMRLGNGTDETTGLGYAYVEFTSSEYQKRALTKLDGMAVEGERLKLSPSRIAISKGKAPRPPTDEPKSIQSPRPRAPSHDRRTRSRSRSRSRGHIRDRLRSPDAPPRHDDDSRRSGATRRRSRSPRSPAGGYEDDREYERSKRSRKY